jgi:HAD superfamily hydrolase (TIGR01509 family)
MGGVELVIFDCDGVLVDSERLIVEVESQLLTELGWPLTSAQVAERFVGRSDADMLAEIEATLGRPVPEWPEQYQHGMETAFRAELTAVPGIEVALDAIEARGWPTWIASSGTHDKMRLTLGLTGLYRRFEGRISSATEVARGKPAPDLFLHVAALATVHPTRCVVVEDSPSGVAAARAAGMPCFGFAGGITPAERLEGPGTVVFDDMAQLPDLIDAHDRRA